MNNVKFVFCRLVVVLWCHDLQNLWWFERRMLSAWVSFWANETEILVELSEKKWKVEACWQHFVACWQHKNQEDELQLAMICKTLVVLPGFGNIAGSIAFKLLEDVCVHNNGVLEVSTSRSTASSSNSSNNNTAMISTQLIFCTTNRSLNPTLCRNCPQRVQRHTGWSRTWLTEEALIGSDRRRARRRSAVCRSAS